MTVREYIASLRRCRRIAFSFGGVMTALFLGWPFIWACFVDAGKTGHPDGWNVLTHPVSLGRYGMFALMLAVSWFLPYPLCPKCRKLLTDEKKILRSRKCPKCGAKLFVLPKRKHSREGMSAD